MELMICVECLALVPDNEVCDTCGDALCENCRYSDEGIVFCHGCFTERQREFEEEN